MARDLNWKTLKSQSREIIINMWDYFECEKTNGEPLLDEKQVAQFMADAVCGHRKTVSKVSEEKKKIKNFRLLEEKESNF
jgi:hypothetical protein